MVLAKPKPVKMKRKENPYCHCKYPNVNRGNYWSCAKCKKIIRAKYIPKILDRLINEMVKKIVLLRDGFCVTPAPRSGHGQLRQPGHLITRGKKSVIYDLRNVNEQCDSCNGLHENFPERYNNWYANKFGMESYNQLCKDGDETVDLSVSDLEELLRQLTEIYSRQLTDKTFRPRFTQKEILSGQWRNQ